MKNKQNDLSYNLIYRTKIGSKYRLTESEAYKTVNRIADYYPDFIRLYIPNSPVKILKSGFEKANKASSQSAQNKYETDKERSIRRTRKLIKDYILCNGFDYFATFTFKEDRQNIDKCKAKMSNWLKNQNKRNGRFKYLVVPEFHKDGKSLHFHALLSGYSGKIKESRNTNGRLIKKRGAQVYELSGYTLGFTNLQKIDKDSKVKTAWYIIKYISKDMPIFENKNRYWSSKNLKKPVREYNPDEWHKFVKPDRVFENDHGKIMEFERAKNPLIDMVGGKFESEK